MVGATTLSDEQARDIEREMWYINVHTELNPSGELRGNILAPGTLPAAAGATPRCLFRLRGSLSGGSEIYDLDIYGITCLFAEKGCTRRVLRCSLVDRFWSYGM